MADEGQLARSWVEVAEESDSERTVFRPMDYPVPPTRGGRRRLDLSTDHKSTELGAGPTDAYESKSTGTWTHRGSELHLDLTSWRGTYVIEELSDEILVLRRR